MLFARSADWSRPAKPVQRNALGPELRCCLQDCAAAASGRGASVAGGSAQRRQDSSAGIASSNRDCGRAIFGDCRGTPRGIRDRRRSFSGDSRCGAFAGTRLRRRRPGGAGTSKAGRSAGSRGNAVHPYERRCLTPQASPAADPGDLETAVECLPRPRQWSHPPMSYRQAPHYQLLHHGQYCHPSGRRQTPIITVIEPLTIISGGPTHSAMSVTPVQPMIIRPSGQQAAGLAPGCLGTNRHHRTNMRICHSGGEEAWFRTPEVPGPESPPAMLVAPELRGRHCSFCITAPLPRLDCQMKLKAKSLVLVRSLRINSLGRRPYSVLPHCSLEGKPGELRIVVAKI